MVPIKRSRGYGVTSLYEVRMKHFGDKRSPATASLPKQSKKPTVDREHKGSMAVESESSLINNDLSTQLNAMQCCMGKTAPIAKLSPTATSEQIE